MKSDLGHVAPDFADGKFFNTLAVRPPLRLKLRIGEIEDLFPHDPATDEGRMERLQVLGLFYFPLKHPKAKEAHQTGWAWVQEKTFAKTDESIKTALRDRIVVLPEAGKFAKIRLPGGYTFTGYEGHAWETAKEICEAESTFYQDNPVLGKIPLIAKVERRAGPDQWEPAEGVEVRFQLVDPDPLPAFDYAKPEAEQLAPFPHAEGVQKAIQFYEQSRPAAAQTFSVGETDGFTRPHASGRKLERDTKPFAKTEEVDALSVKTTTNPEGEAGVIFTPSRLGGERYRIRAFLESGESVETGTLVVWRNIRISRFLRKKIARPVSQPLLDEAKVDEAKYLGLIGAADGLPEIALADMAAEFSRAYGEMEFDADAEKPADIPGPEYTAAYDAAVARGEEKKKWMSKKLDVKALLFPTAEAASENSVVLLPTHLPDAYNAQANPAERMTWPQDQEAVKLLTMHMQEAFVATLSKQGYLPGLTIIQAGEATSWQLMRMISSPSYATPFRSVELFGGAKLFETPEEGNRFLGLAIHELGHCLYREHAPGKDQIPGSDPPRFTTEPKDPRPELHDDPAHLCFMSYARRRGPFCAKCTLALRGWDITKLPKLTGQVLAGGPSMPPPPAPGGEEISTFKVLEMTFLSDHAKLKSSQDWTNKGNPVPKPEWTPAGGQPVSHTKDQPVKVKVKIDVGPAGAEPLKGTLIGKGLYLSFEEPIDVTAGESTHTLTTKKKLPDLIGIFAGDVDWSLQLTDGRTLPGNHTDTPLYVTYATPRDDKVGTWLEDGVTVKRMKLSVTWGQSTGTLDPHKIVEELMKLFSEYALLASPNVPPQFGHPQYLNAAVGGAWPLAEYVSETGECQAIVRLIRGVIRQLGLPGEIKMAVVWAVPAQDDQSSIFQIEDWDENPMAGLNESKQVGTETWHAALSDDQLEEGQWYPPSESEMKGGGLSPGLNRYEACLWYDVEGKTRIYAGGVGGYDKSELFQIIKCFWGLVWVTFEKPQPSDKYYEEKYKYENGYRVKKIVQTYEALSL